jgi:hypothetical protein
MAAMRSFAPACFVALVLLLACGREEATTPPATSAAATAATAAPSAAPNAPAVAEVEPVPSNVPVTIDGANVTLDNTTADGLEMEKIQCKGGGSLFGGVALLGGLAKQKDALAACAPKLETVRVHFVFDAGKTSDVRVADASSPAVARCVADAVAAATFSDTGACVLSVKVGKP